MLVTLFGITTSVREVQPENADWPMLVTLSGITTSVREMQSVNAQLSMEVTPGANVTEKGVLPPLINPAALSAIPTLLPFTTPPVCPTTTATGTAAADGSADRGRRLVRMRKARVREISFFMWVYLQSFVLPS
jgi:hypothetical protein